MKNMECPECGEKTFVTDSREYAGAVYRQRKCKVCGFKFYTEEAEIDDERTIKDMQAYQKWKYRTKGL